MMPVLSFALLALISEKKARLTAGLFRRAFRPQACFLIRSPICFFAFGGAPTILSTTVPFL